MARIHRGRCILSGRGPGKLRIKKVSLRKESEREPNDLVELKENGSRRLPVVGDESPGRGSITISTVPPVLPSPHGRPVAHPLPRTLRAS